MLVRNRVMEGFTCRCRLCSPAGSLPIETATGTGGATGTLAGGVTGRTAVEVGAVGTVSGAGTAKPPRQGPDAVMVFGPCCILSHDNRGAEQLGRPGDGAGNVSGLVFVGHAAVRLG